MHMHTGYKLPLEEVRAFCATTAVSKLVIHLLGPYDPREAGVMLLGVQLQREFPWVRIKIMANHG